jgi:hypothetical protein
LARREVYRIDVEGRLGREGRARVKTNLLDQEVQILGDLGSEAWINHSVSLWFFCRRCAKGTEAEAFLWALRALSLSLVGMGVCVERDAYAARRRMRSLFHLFL